MGKKIKEINPFMGVVSTLEAMKKQALGIPVRDESNVFRCEQDGWIVDTCVAFDTDTWETGILPSKEGDWVIVEQYEDKEKAEAGHENWVRLMQENPNRELEDINAWGL